LESLTSFFNQNQKHLITAITFALVVLMAKTSAHSFLFFYVDLNRTEPTINPSTSTNTRRVAVDTSQIRNLFGNFQATETVVVDQNVPETTLNLELQGIFTADDPEDSTAIVAQRGQSGQLFRIGDRLPGNATLEAVFTSYILIKRGSRTEKLAFDDPSIGQGFAAAGSAGSVNPVSANPNVNQASRRAQDSLTRLDSVRERIANRSSQIASQRGISQTSQTRDLRSAISDFQNRLSENPSEVLQELGVSESGGGYRIGGQVPQATLQQAGLQEGDVVLSVNGQSASSVMGSQNLMNQVMQSERARVEVQRGQRRFVVTVPIPKS
jgi:general secretion pathway protein C